MSLGDKSLSDRLKECKQAEFLLHGRFPFELVTRIGVAGHAAADAVATAMNGAAHRPPVQVLPGWYY